jgi:hypothetical protein
MYGLIPVRRDGLDNLRGERDELSSKGPQPHLSSLSSENRTEQAVIGRIKLLSISYLPAQHTSHHIYCVIHSRPGPRG